MAGDRVWVAIELRWGDRDWVRSSWLEGSIELGAAVEISIEFSGVAIEFSI